MVDVLIDVPLEEGEDFKAPHVWVSIRDLNIYTSVLDVGSHFEVVVTFNVLYDVSNNEPFGRDVALRLAIQSLNGNYYINDKTVISSQ